VLPNATMSLLSDAARANADVHAAAFHGATPFRHVVIPGFFEAGLCEKLRVDFPGFEKRHALNEMGEVGGKAVRMDVRDISPAYRELDDWLQTPEFLGYVSRVTGIPDLLYDPDYIGGGTHENRDGQALDAHVDFNYHPRTRWHRRLNLIVYLNPEWDEAWGGCLDLHADPWNPARDSRVRIPPLFNLCAIFETTERSWHGFDEIRLPEGRKDLSRKSFAIYLYTRERPAEETASSHATIYAPEGMPDWKTGRTLSSADMQELAKRFTRMRTQLRYLYEREKDFGAQISGYEWALGEARRAQRLELQGYATQPGAPVGMWPDGWTGAELVVDFVPTRKAKALTLELMAPRGMEGEQTLHIELGGHGWTQSLYPGRSTTVELPLRMTVGQQVALRIHAERTWIPAQAGESGDERALAYMLLAVFLRH
jgi:hypothetical protein